MNVQSAIPQHWWERIRWARHGFLAGLILGLLMGWFFHGVISVFVRFGLVLLLLLPLLAIGYLWWRSNRGGRPAGSGPQTGQVVTWSSETFRAPNGGESYPGWMGRPGDDGIPTTGRVSDARPMDLPTPAPSRAEPRTSPLPDDVEAELRELKRRQESGR